MELINHIWTYHAVHVIGLIGIMFIIEINYRYKKKLANNKKLDYTKLVITNKGRINE